MERSERSVLLSSGQRMPLVGLGMWQAEDEQSVRVALETAIDAGYRHIDTAFAYKNEAYIGNTLQKLFQEGKVKREEVFIVTKLPGNGMRPDAVEYFFRKSLSALQLDYVDLYLIHTPFAAKRTDDDNDFFPIKDGTFLGDGDADIVQTWKAMESLVDKGLVKSIGLSNFNSKQIQRIYDSARIKPTNLQVECHAYLPQTELFDFCKKLNISMTAYSPIGSPGRLEFAAKRFGVKAPPEQNLLDDPKLELLCKKHGKTPAQILLRYLVQRGIIVIPKSTNPDRIRENIQIFDFTLTDDDMMVLKSMANNKRYFTMDFFKGLKEHPEFPFNIPF